MSGNINTKDVFLETKLHDEKNLEIIDDAFQSGRIDEATHDYLTNLYTNSMDLFREVFLTIGKCFGAPKAAVRKYDYESDTAIDEPITISYIHPLEPYLVNHRLDADPMRNQFFVSTKGHQIDLAVSSIVTVIVAAQKNINRALDKITGKYYSSYVKEVAKVAYDVIVEKTGRVASAQAISDKIYETFSKSFITDASSTVLGIIGSVHQEISAQMVRELDKIETPYERLKDVWRIKCLFDMVPQARTFIERVSKMWPEKILDIKDAFCDITNPRGYRDAKLVINIGDDENVVPMEIICQVRTFFEFEHQTHLAYEKSRKGVKGADNIEAQTEILHLEGVKKYNAMICDCVEDLFDRIGWNILYSAGNEDMLFDGFPVLTTMYYPQKISDLILEKVDNAVENEVFFVENAPAKLTKDQEIRIFRWMAKFILIAAMPYSYADWTVQTDTMAGKFFNFIMKELQRYYKK
ncbi:MAG: hypothetical protein IKN73_01425 [Alphaproteobacteria bacterium]|nr:hypothetical protein [Alphaproteobacteria bacterium]